ncbi:ureidoglycolate lyase [Comamonas aquatica]|uniref:ureidoglycolate lyase n=1 Tax=Comamonas aquatica TaxID=225991 RepID=UPI0030B94908
MQGQSPALPAWPINGGNAMRHELLADLQLTAEGGVPMLVLFSAQARQFPLDVTELERHALGSQTFVPLGTQRFVVVVARPGRPPPGGRAAGVRHRRPPGCGAGTGDLAPRPAGGGGRGFCGD